MIRRHSERHICFSYLFIAATVGFVAGKTSDNWSGKPMHSIEMRKALMWPLAKMREATSSAQRLQYLQTVKQRLEEFDEATVSWQRRLGLSREKVSKSKPDSTPTSRPRTQQCSCHSEGPKTDMSAVREMEQDDADHEEYEPRRREGGKSRKPNMEAAREMEQHDADHAEYERRLEERIGRRKGDN